jgi:hypothetical protein
MLRIDEILQYVVVIIAIVVAVYAVKKFSKKPHQTLTRLVAANIFLDFLAIAIWGLFPSTQWSIYQLNFTVVGIEAAIAAALFAATLAGLIKSKSWAPYTAIILTINQRVFANYVFFLSIGNVITLIWSLLIIYFAYLDIRRASESKAETAKTPQATSTPT